MGIAGDSSELAIPTNYELPYEDICVAVSEVLIRKYGLSMLSFNAGFADHHGQVNPSLPSWCSDWRLGTSYTLLKDRPAARNSFNACGTLKGTTQVIFDRTKGRMSLIGTIVDSIRHVRECDVTAFDSNHKYAVSQLLSQLRGLSSFQKAPSGSNVSAYVEQALFCVPIAHQGPVPSISIPDSQGRSQELFEAYDALSDETPKSSNLPSEPSPLGRLNSYVQEVIRRAAGRAIFACENNYLGLGPVSMQKGDLVCIFQDSSVPSIIRPLRNGCFLYIGEAYVHGIMYGEYFNRSKHFDHKTFDIE